ncbi:MAG: hypothetical protein ACC660_04565 [Acidimicrobiales bacterium]
MARKNPRLSESDTAEGRALRDLASAAVEEALRLAPEVGDAPSGQTVERAVDLEFRSVDDAIFVRKRINEALAVAEWGDAVSAWVWESDRHQRGALTDRGRSVGWELRLERPRNE